MALLVHGVLGAGVLDASALAGVADEPGVEVRLVEHPPLAGLVSETEDQEAIPSRANLLAHTRVLERAMEHTTVIPMRFGVVVPDESALVADYLEPERDALTRSLRRLDGHLELRLRGRYDEETVLREVLAADPKAARLRGRESFEAKMELGERIVAGIEVLRERDAGRVSQQLGGFAADIAAGPLAEQLDVFTMSFLVPRDGLEAFDREVERLGEQMSPIVSLELVGPVPPFSFAEVEGA